MFTRKRLIVGGIIIVLIGLGWLIFGRKPKVAYTAYTASPSSIRNTVELSGKVQAGKVANLRFAAGGLVSYVGAQEGDTVKVGTTLASLDSRLLRKILEEKLNLYAIQRDTFDQTVDDNDNSVPAGDLARTLKRLLEKNQYQLDNTVKDVEYQALTIQLSRISSPIAGILVSSPITAAGVNVLATDTWTVVDPTSLRFEADLDESDLKNVHSGQKVIIHLDAFPDKELDSTVGDISFSPTETTTSTTYTLKIPLAKEALTDLRLGLNGTADVVLEEKSGVLVIPMAAVNEKNGKSMVTVKKGNDYVNQEVTTGIEEGGNVEITGGLSAGDVVYVKQ